jgi:quercetin dioxygenase-like cupin family protein
VYTRLYATPDGETHFQDVELDFAPSIVVAGLPQLDVARPLTVRALVFAELGKGFSSDWHPAPQRQFVIVLAGEMELTVTDGQVRRFGPGGVFLAEDTTGKGHQVRTTGAEACSCVMVPCT